MSSPLLSANDITLTIGGRTLIKGLSLDLDCGESLAVLGCNGSGKSSLLLTLAGLRPPTSGSVHLDGTELTELRRPAIARRLGLLLQDQHDPFPITVEESVLSGRHPHLTSWQRESDIDRAIATAALEELGIDTLRGRQVETLSGGERRRLAIATLFTQQPPLMLLDEPTNHLDLRHQQAVLDSVGRRVADGDAAIMVLHDINQAARHADRVLLLHGDGRWEMGERQAMLEPERLSRLYGTVIRAAETPQGKVYYSG